MDFPSRNFQLSVLTSIYSGPEPHHQHPGDSTLAVIVNALPVGAALPAEVVVALLPVAAVETTLLARTIAGTATMIDETVVIALVAQMIGKLPSKCRFVTTSAYTQICRDRDIKDDREEVRENGTNGEDRKGELALPTRSKPT